jgi:hypothetical protein
VEPLVDRETVGPADEVSALIATVGRKARERVFWP